MIVCGHVCGHVCGRPCGHCAWPSPARWGRLEHRTVVRMSSYNDVCPLTTPRPHERRQRRWRRGVTAHVYMKGRAATPVPLHEEQDCLRRDTSEPRQGPPDNSRQCFGYGPANEGDRRASGHGLVVAPHPLLPREVSEGTLAPSRRSASVRS